jgi:hypothetical protein
MKQLKVGDFVRITNHFVDYTVEIERVTKTQAISKPYNDSGARHKFKLEFFDPDYLTVLPRTRFNITRYKLIKS